MALERQVIRSDIVRSWAGLISAFIITMTAIVSGGALIYGGHDWAGLGVVTLGLSGLAGTFIYGTSSQRRERADKARMMSGRK
jgi:hypothetical protein